mmetsp:Transcript_2056/g.8110  ORF Transcript_2056/g.8110 Transcript_2056/m.8110 type:complete len:261 (+) Transcript_2056:402-1184(+)
MSTRTTRGPVAGRRGGRAVWGTRVTGGSRRSRRMRRRGRKTRTKKRDATSRARCASRRPAWCSWGPSAAPCTKRAFRRHCDIEARTSLTSLSLSLVRAARLTPAGCGARTCSLNPRARRSSPSRRFAEKKKKKHRFAASGGWPWATRAGAWLCSPWRTARRRRRRCGPRRRPRRAGSWTCSSGAKGTSSRWSSAARWRCGQNKRTRLETTKKRSRGDATASRALRFANARCARRGAATSSRWATSPGTSPRSTPLFGTLR